MSTMKKPKGDYRQYGDGNLYDMLSVAVEVTQERQPDSTHMFRCPLCGDTGYVGPQFMERIVAAQAWLATQPLNSVEILGPACAPCHAVMEVRVLGKED